MTSTTKRSGVIAWLKSTRGLSVLGGLLSVFVFGCAVLTSQVFMQLRDLREVEHGLPEHRIADIEPAHGELMAALDAVIRGETDAMPHAIGRLAALSDRVAQVLRADKATPDLTGPDTIGTLQELDAALQRVAPVIAQADSISSDEGARQADALRAFTVPLHQLTQSAVLAQARRIAAERTALTDRLRQLAIMAAAMIVTMSALMVQLWRLYRRFRRHANTNRAVSDRLRTILDTALDAVVVVDETGTIREANPAAKALFNLCTPTGLRRNIAAVLSRRDEDGMIGEVTGTRLMASCENGTNRCSKLLARNPEGVLFPVEMSAALAVQDGRKVTVCYLRDISRRIRAEAEMKQAHDRLVTSEQTHARFLGMISHEMRTPLNGIVGTLDLLEETHLNEEQHTYTKIMQGASQQLLTQINDALNLTQTSGGKVSLTRKVFDLDALLDEAVASQRSLADSMGTSLTLRLPKHKLGCVKGDRARVLQILVNLMSNAVKFTRNGTVTIEVARSSGKSKWVEFQVSDTGVGIPERDLKRIFDDFVRLRPEDGNGATGTGLGLGIVRELVSQMRGKLGAESIEGEGSLFWVRLPLRAAKQAQVAPEPATVSDGLPRRLDVLVVEDNETSRFVLGEMLRKDGHRVTTAECGRSAVKKANIKAFDLILMDVRMPGLDGKRAARRIRDGGGPSSAARLLFLTAHVETDARASFRGLGAEAVLAKPLRRAALREILAAVPATGAAPVHDPDPDRDTVEHDMPIKQGSAKDTTEPFDVIDDSVLSQLQDTLTRDRFDVLLQRFETEGTRFIEEISTHPHQNRSEDLGSRLHVFAGSAATFGATTLQRALCETEATLQDGEPDQIQSVLGTLPGIWERTRERLHDRRKVA
ncbi:MAG: ATP-binding protein [Pseudomonadota bacterium]